MEKWYATLVGIPILGMRIRARAIVAVLRNLAKTSSGEIGSICDCGCGRGMFTLFLARQFPQAQVVGYDIDQGAITRNQKTARGAGLSNVTFECRDLQTPANGRLFHLLLATDCLEHIVEDEKQLVIFRGMLHPKGHLLIHVPNWNRNLFGIKRRNFMGIEGHVRPGYKKERLEAMLMSAGFAVVDSFYNYNSIETLANDIGYLITGGREKRRILYAVVLPFLIALVHWATWKPQGEGSGIVIHAVAAP